MHIERRASPLIVLLALAIVSLGSCSPLSPVDASDDIADIIPSRAPGVDFFVMFSNRPNLMINGDLPADRLSVIGARLKRLGCRDPRMLRERAEPRDGTWALGRPKMVYASEWVCQ